MNRLARIRTKFPLIALFSLYAYLAFHAFSGSQGLMRWMQYSDQIDNLTVKHEALLERRNTLQHDVDALGTDALDLDELDIQVRDNLFLSEANEITIWLDPSP